MFTKKKKIFLLSFMVLLLVATAVVNVVLNRNVVDTGTQTSAGFFATYRTDRESARNERMLYLNSILNDASANVEAKAEASLKKQQMSDNIELELACEGLIKSQGFKDCILTTGGNYFSVVIDSAVLTSEEVAKIAEIVQSQAQTELDNIVIFPIS